MKERQLVTLIDNLFVGLAVFLFHILCKDKIKQFSFCFRGLLSVLDTLCNIMDSSCGLG